MAVDQPGRTWEPWSRADRTGLARYALTSAARLLRVPVSTHDLHRQEGGRRALIRAIYEELAKKEIRYNIEPHGAPPNRQRIRTPHEILEAPGHGTCLDLALLFSGLCLGHDLIPVLVMLDGHALVIVSLGHGLPEIDDYGRRERPLFVEGQLSDDGGWEALPKLVEQGEYLAVECTGFAHAETLPGSVPEGVGRVDGRLPFDRACLAGLETLTQSDRPFRYALDVGALHGLGITPFEILPEAIAIGREPGTTPAEVTTGAVSPAGPRGIEFETITLLETKLRGKVDEDGKALADEVGKAFGVHDFDRVVASRSGSSAG